MCESLLPERDRKLLKQEEKIFSTRKNVEEIKEELEKHVTNREGYWAAFRSFIHGHCTKQTFDSKMHKYLETNEGRVLHNRFIRAIIFNAHFSVEPPPNVVVPPVKFPEEDYEKISYPEDGKTKNHHFRAFSAAEMRHIQSTKQLSDRLYVLLASSGIRLSVEPRSAELLQINLIRYIALVLKRCLNRSFQAKITVNDVIETVKKDELCSIMTSPLVLMKYIC